MKQMANAYDIQFKKLPGKNSIDVHIADSFFKAGSNTAAHRHDFFEFFIIKKGRIIHRLNGVDYDQICGDICFIMPGDIHAFGVKRSDGEPQITNIAFSRDQGMKAYNFLSQTANATMPHRRYWFSAAPSVLTGINRKIKLIQDALPDNNHTAHLFFRALLTELLSELSFSKQTPIERAPDWLIQAIEAMKKKENYCTGMKRFLGLCGKSQEHCIRSLKTFYNTTPSQLINAYRLNAAAQRLVTTPQSVISIMLDEGFNNISYFNSSFKQFFGKTPREYRRMNRLIFNQSA